MLGVEMAEKSLSGKLLTGISNESTIASDK